MYGRPGVGKSCITRLCVEDAINKDCVVFFSKDFREAVTCIKAFREVEPDRKVLFVFEDVDELVGYSEHAFLEFMDGEDSLNGCLVLGTTNYPDRLPERVLRAGRLDVKVEVHNPPAEGRLAYFKSKLPTISDETISEMVESTNDFSFAECREFLVNHLLYGNSIKRSSSLVKAVDRLRVENSMKSGLLLKESFRSKTTGSQQKSGNYSGVFKPEVDWPHKLIRRLNKSSDGSYDFDYDWDSMFISISDDVGKSRNKSASDKLVHVSCNIEKDPDGYEVSYSDDGTLS